MSLRQDPRARRFVSWLAFGVAGAEVVVAVASTVVHLPEPYSPGWLGFAFEMPFLVVPLVVVGVALRSSGCRLPCCPARRTAGLRKAAPSPLNPLSWPS